MRLKVRLLPLDNVQLREELVSRLYGQGVPNTQMPSIKRNVRLRKDGSKNLKAKLHIQK